MAFEYGWNEKKSKMPALISDFVKTSQYIIQNKHAPEDKSLPYAVCLAHANYFMERDKAKTYNKRSVPQAKAVDKLLRTVDSITERVQSNFDAIDQRFQDQNKGVFKKYISPDLNQSGYNSLMKYLDIYAALLDINVHVMVNGMVRNRYVAGRDHNRNSLISVFDSLRRDHAPHLYLFRVGVDGVYRYHVISNIVSILDDNFGYLNFCEGCYQTTYATSETHKERFCKKVRAYKQENDYKGRIQEDTLRGIVNSTCYAKRASDEQMAERWMLLSKSMLDDAVDETCGCKRSHDDDESLLEQSAVEQKRAKRALRKAAKEYEEAMSYFDSDDECNKSEYA